MSNLYLIHSAKGTSWSKDDHAYTEKRTSASGKTYYVYGDKETEDEDDERSGHAGRGYEETGRNGLDVAYEKYSDWYDSTKFGKFMNTPLTELFKIRRKQHG